MQSLLHCLSLSPHPPSAPYGRTQVSDHARHAVLLSLSPRFCGNGCPTATRSFSVTCARRAGIKQLYTPWGRPATLPAATVSMNGSPKSYQVRAICSSSDSTVSVQKDQWSPDLEKSASITEMFGSANGG